MYAAGRKWEPERELEGRQLEKQKLVGGQAGMQMGRYV